MPVAHIMLCYYGCKLCVCTPFMLSMPYQINSVVTDHLRANQQHIISHEKSPATFRDCQHTLSTAIENQTHIVRELAGLTNLVAVSLPHSTITKNSMGALNLQVSASWGMHYRPVNRDIHKTVFYCSLLR